MRDDQHRFLMLLGQLPARLTAEQAAWVLNCQVHDLPALMSARLLKPLANPAPNAIKFFATADLLEQMRDRNWLVRVTATINQHWQRKNGRKKELVMVAQEAGDTQGNTPILTGAAGRHESEGGNAGVVRAIFCEREKGASKTA